MITVACVLRSGGCYDLDYVKRLADGVRSNLTIPHRIICLTDRMDGAEWLDVCSPVGLTYDWPGWWAKIELFKIKPPVLYFDLDTAIVGNIDPLAEWVSNHCNGLMMLKGFYRGDKCSGIMGWRYDMSLLFRRFLEHYAPRADFIDRHNAIRMRANRKNYRGDQEWLATVIPKENIPVIYVQDVFPGIYSYKVDVAERGLPENAKVVCFHGRPRPHEVDLERMTR